MRVQGCSDRALAAPLVAIVHRSLFPSKSCSVQARDTTPSLGSFVSRSSETTGNTSESWGI